MRTETVPTIEADPDDPNFSADNIPHVVALYFGLDRPINLGCVVRNAKSLTFNFQFNVELPGACGESLEATRDRIPTLCDLERVDVDGLSLDCQGQRCTTDALNLQWVCSLRMPADILLRPECLDEDIPE